MQGPQYKSPPLVERWPPRCPPYLDTNSVDDLLPYLEAVAKRTYSTGLWAAWDLKPGERVLLRVDNWHDPLCVEAAVKAIENSGCTCDVITDDLGPKPVYDGGHHEVEIWLARAKDLPKRLAQWEEYDKDLRYDKVLWDSGGPIPANTRVKFQRFPFITPEMVMTSANTIPTELIDAIDEWTWSRIRAAKLVHITDPEGTDLTYTNRDEYYDAKREYFNEKQVQIWYPHNVPYGRTYLSGHLWGKPNFLLPKGLEDGHGVIAGTANHIGPVEYIQLMVNDSRITSIEGGGRFGDKLRAVMERTKNVQFPHLPGKGQLYWWEASIGTNPKIHRPRKDFLTGRVTCIYERTRSGVIHIGFGTVTTSWPEMEAAQAQLGPGHFHVHLYFPTVTLDMLGGGKEVLIEDGHLLALDDSEVRKVAAQYGDPDELLKEDWIPAMPGINLEGDYFRDYASDPMDWTMAELHMCRKWHDLYMKMVTPAGAAAGHHGHHH